MMKGKGTQKKARKMKVSWDDRIYGILTNFFLVVFVILVAYPIYFVVVASVSDPQYVNNGAILLYPKGFTLLGYEKVFADDRIWSGYGNTILYTFFGTILGTSVVTMAGYALSRKDLLGRGIIMKIIVFTMYFSGGMIPFYLVVRNLNLVNSRLLMVILGSVSAYNIIIVRSFMTANISEDLREAATIDGCGNGYFFFRIVVPLSKAVIAVMVLFIAVSYWNAYFNAMIFLTDRDKYPLQLYLREILLITSASSSSAAELDPETALRLETMVQVIKYGVIVVSTAPIMCVYPFIQKYFVKGVMIGSVKG